MVVITAVVRLEKAVTTQDYTVVHFLMLDISKAFDTIRRNSLIEIIEPILDKDELHLIKILIEDVTLQVKIGKTTGRVKK